MNKVLTLCCCLWAPNSQVRTDRGAAAVTALVEESSDLPTPSPNAGSAASPEGGSSPQPEGSRAQDEAAESLSELA